MAAAVADHDTGNAQIEETIATISKLFCDLSGMAKLSSMMWL
jgi:hypothetical protein